MRIAIVSRMFEKSYSGGRMHAWIIAESLSYMGNDVYFITNNHPVFKDSMEHSGHDKIKLILTDDFNPVIPDVYDLDYVVLIPHRSINETYYRKVRNFTVYMNAKLILINYESVNWMNSYLSEPMEEKLWTPWLNTCLDGCMIMCSNKESMKYAKEYYKINPMYTVFDYWYPPINTIVADNMPIGKKENRIIVFLRVNHKYKGSYDILDIMKDPAFTEYTFVFIYGSGEQDSKYEQYIKKLEQTKKKYGVSYEIHVQLTDKEKYVQINRAKYMLFPSYFEGHGTPPLEAQYFDTLCFVYDLPVLRETCEDRVIYCKHGDWLDMQKNLRNAITDDTAVSGCRDKLYEIVNFKRQSEKLHELLVEHLEEDWRDPNAKINLIKTDNDLLKAENTSLETRNASLKTKNEALLAGRDANTAKLVALKAKNEALLAGKGANNAKLAALKAKNEALVANKGANNAKFDALRVSIDDKNTRIITLKSINDTLRTKIKGLANSNNLKKAKIVNLKTLVDKIKVKRDVLRNKNESLSIKRDELQAKLVTFKLKIDTMKADNEALRARRDALSISIGKLNEDCKLNQNINNTLTIENKLLVDENNSLKLEMDKLVKAYNELINSKSWKITKPLRGFMRILHKILKK